MVRSLLVLLLLALVEAEIGVDGLCRLNTFVTFTNNGSSAVSMSGDANRANPGFVHMAAALLAMEHFNSRNTSVVLQLANLTTDCDVQFDINNSLILDSGTVTHMAVQALFDLMPNVPCAIAGPGEDLPAMELSTWAVAARLPLVAQRAYNLRVVYEQFSPFTAQTFPSLTDLACRVVEYLIYQGRTNFVNVLYPLSDSGIQRREVFTVTLQGMGMEYFSQFYVSPLRDATDPGGVNVTWQNFQLIKDRGFRTIVLTLEDPTRELPLVAYAAEAVGLNTGEYLWVIAGPMEAKFLRFDDPIIVKLLYGSIWISGMEPMTYQKENDTFYASLTSQGPDFVDRVNAVNPIPPGVPGHYFAPPDFFQTLETVEFGAGFMYDTVMSIGIGACAAAKSENGTVSGAAHRDGIRKVAFKGGSGKVSFERSGVSPGARASGTSWWGAYNLLPTIPPSETSAPFAFTDLILPANVTWFNRVPVTFADGRHVPPDLLRDVPPQNYVPTGLTGLGFALFGTVQLAVIVTSVWVFIRRNHRVLRASQPYFLYVLCFGSSVYSSAIVPLSFDEGDGYTTAQLSSCCMSVPWLVALGHIITYGALFAKLWRVNKVLQFTRRKIDTRHVTWPVMLFALAAMLILALWTGLDPLKWERVTINDFTGESIGQCSSNHMWAFAAPLAVVMLLPTVLTGFMAYKTQDVDDAYQESWWIFMLILLQVELMLVGAPVIAILRGVSTTGRYVGFIILLWAFPISTLLLIMLPKLMAYRQAVKAAASGSSELTNQKRGAKGGGRVSGVTIPENVITATVNGVVISGVSNTTGSSVVVEDSSLAAYIYNQSESPLSPSEHRLQELPDSQRTVDSEGVPSAGVAPSASHEPSTQLSL